MSLFTKKEMNTAAAEQFWKWFAEQENWITQTIHTNGADVVWAVDAQIKPVFPYFKRELEFQLGYNDGMGEFFFFHFGNKNLIRDGEALKAMMPSALAERWNFILER